MRKPVERLLDVLTLGGKQTPEEAAQQVVDTTVNKAGLLAQVWARCSVGNVFFANESDRELLDRVEKAGKGLLWCVRVDPGSAVSHAVHIGSSPAETKGIAIKAPTLIASENLTVLDDGMVLLWTADGEHDTQPVGCLLPAFKSRKMIDENVHVYPENKRTGLPYMVPQSMEIIMRVLNGAIAQHDATAQSRPTGQYL